jgi:predicted enzyme related to lactoylglutathione lyase
LAWLVGIRNLWPPATAVAREVKKMVTRDTAWPPGTPCWVDLGVKDIPKATAFYSRLFGWDINDTGPESGGYCMCEIDGQPVAGIGASQGDMPIFWTTYLASEDADATAAKIKAAGGQVMMDPFDVMDVGRMFIAVDPGGAFFGVWQARAHTGVRLANEPGSLIWSENMSRSYADNKAFYGAVFGYDFGDIGTETMQYSTVDVDGRPVGGIGEIGANQSAETPASWSTYFAVADTDAAAAKVTALGGRVIAPPFDSPYGRMAVVADDQGAVFSLMSADGEPES